MRLWCLQRRALGRPGFQFLGTFEGPEEGGVSADDQVESDLWTDDLGTPFITLWQPSFSRTTDRLGVE